MEPHNLPNPGKLDFATDAPIIPNSALPYPGMDGQESSRKPTQVLAMNVVSASLRA